MKIPRELVISGSIANILIYRQGMLTATHQISLPKSESLKIISMEYTGNWNPIDLPKKVRLSILSTIPGYHKWTPLGWSKFPSSYIVVIEYYEFSRGKLPLTYSAIILSLPKLLLMPGSLVNVFADFHYSRQVLQNEVFLLFPLRNISCSEVTSGSLNSFRKQ